MPIFFGGEQEVLDWASPLWKPEGEESVNDHRNDIQRPLNFKHPVREPSADKIGRGAVEGQAKTLGLRLKARGARWRKKNVRPMASLVCVRNSIQWDPYWALAA